ncbi:MAG TPA: PLP-dependent aminotransferase family protein [Candidatus Acidoferrum sp.]|nr:PLP-dependent aminotransferase family protein [Candidatus Acidoferrum sp.]
MKKVPSTFFPVISVDRKAPKPLHRQIYDSFREMIVGRALSPGQQIPSSRALAAELRISRIPVLTAYSQLLAEGYFESRAGSGTYVCSTLPDQPTLRPASSAGSTTPMNLNSGVRSISRRASLLPRYETFPWFRGMGAFSVSQPAFDHFPFQIWSRIVMRHCRNPHASQLQYGSPQGFEPLREAICAYLRTARAVRCEPRQVMIVTGSQQALEIATRALLDSGSSAWVEEPGYWLTAQVLTAAGCRLVSVPVDEEGLDVQAGIALSRKARAAFVAPSHQYPLGATMSASRRLQLLDWAQRSGSWIIEDDYDSEYRYGSMPIASLQGLDHGSRVVYIGTFSKILFPSLRLGYVVLPHDLVNCFSSVRYAMDIGPPHFFQAVLTDFMKEGHFARHIRRMRQLYSQRRAVLVESLSNEFGGSLEIVGSEAGMYLTLFLPKGYSDHELAVRAARDRFWLFPLSPAYLGKKKRQGLVLGFGSTSVEEIPRAVRRLKNLMAAARV